MNNFDLDKFEGAIDRNLIVFDTDAKSGEFTLRHLALMRVCGRRSIDKKARLIKIWLPKSIIDFIQSRDIDDEDPKDNIYGEDFGILPDGILTLYQDTYRGSLVHEDKFLCIAEFDNDEYLLGSF